MQKMSRRTYREQAKYCKKKLLTVLPVKSDSDVVFCLQLLCKTLFCTLHLSLRESIDHLSINPILQIGLIHKLSIDSKSLVTL